HPRTQRFRKVVGRSVVEQPAHRLEQRLFNIDLPRRVTEGGASPEQRPVAGPRRLPRFRVRLSRVMVEAVSDLLEAAPRRLERRRLAHFLPPEVNPLRNSTTSPSRIT